MARNVQFPSGRTPSSGWHFDAVGLLAVIGESSMTLHVPALASSWLCLLPHLIPAPQAMLKPCRPTRLPPVPAIVVGVHSGTRVDELNFYAELIHQVDGLQPFEFHEFNITRRFDSASPFFSHERRSPILPMSCALTVGLIIWACLIHDGVAIISLAILSLASLLVGLAMWYQPQLSIRPTDAVVPNGDIVLRTRNGAFVVVHCSDEIARELYIGTEEARYIVGEKAFKLVMAAGTVALMIGVVLLGNCSWTMQAAIGTAYLLLNGAYWFVALLPQTWIWDTSAYHVSEATPPILRLAHVQGIDGINPSYTRTLWYAIQSTKETSWISISGASPKTAAWEEWKKLAYSNRNNLDWDAVNEKDRLMREFKENEEHQYGGEHGFTAANNAPDNVPNRQVTW
ncbi:hypothetical protein ASPWEDRAFT_23879 [Aspergillus wentii DTO 134E9]|uniref:Uncharacterized protein n=1 Tax=Aspergillus wentii DTO 134E9 TaxID=1073089 RepID=A0A1L9S3S4_ASPWE|nr:uncharacterized protein ASPWEDRAFT_23879 [Aspergillus wentii DTO 134E9]OJJ41825.1 hypothetical protein ASPWEDRAFT_23879 [Aspergillus wentii DTO 134E9]